MCLDRLPQSRARRISHTVLTAHRGHQRRQLLVVDVADAGKQMMLDLKIQASHVPSEQAVGTSKIDRGGNLVCGPGRALSVGHRRVEALTHTVSHLKHGTERESEHAAACYVEEQN